MGVKIFAANLGNKMKHAAYVILFFTIFAYASDDSITYVTFDPTLYELSDEKKKALAEKFSPQLFLSQPEPIRDPQGEILGHDIVTLGVDLHSGSYPYTDYIPLNVNDLISNGYAGYILSYTEDTQPPAEQVYLEFYNKVQPEPTAY